MNARTRTAACRRAAAAFAAVRPAAAPAAAVAPARTQLDRELARLAASVARFQYLRYLWAICPESQVAARRAIREEATGIRGRVNWIFGANLIALPAPKGRIKRAS